MKEDGEMDRKEEILQVKREKKAPLSAGHIALWRR